MTDSNAQVRVDDNNNIILEMFGVEVNLGEVEEAEGE